MATNCSLNLRSADGGDIPTVTEADAYAIEETENVQGSSTACVNDQPQNAFDDLSRNFCKFDFCDLCFGITDRIPTECFNFDKKLGKERVVATCLDADNVQIAVGTNVGNIHIFNRQQRKMFTIKGRDKIVCLKLANNGDYLVLGVGLETGMFVVLQLPSSADGKSRKLMQKIVEGVHRCEITCIEWSADGRKLFTGDASGLIMMTLVDFENELFDSSFIYCDVDHCAIVQLAYWGNFLSACTMGQAFLVDISNDCDVRLVGNQGKKNSCKCGIAFVHDDPTAVETRPRLYVSRPRCRLWRVNLFDSETTSGDAHSNDNSLKIAETQQYQQSLSLVPSLPVPLELQDDCRSKPSSNATTGFGLLHPLLNVEADGDGQRSVLITHSGEELYLIDAQSHMLIGWAHFRYRIAGVCVCSSTCEVFVLFADPETTNPLLLRIGSTFADPWMLTSLVAEKHRKKSLQNDVLSSSAVAVKDLLHKLKTGSSQIIEKSAKVLAAGDNDSGDNFELFFNRLRAGSMDRSDFGAGTLAEINDTRNVLGLGGLTTSRASTPDTLSLASGGGGNSLPPWCLEDQSMNENSTSGQQVRVIKSKSRNGKKFSRQLVPTTTITSEVEASKSSPIENNQPIGLETPLLTDDRLSTPTEETYVLNRFNPFDGFVTTETSTATREQLEEMLDSSFLRHASGPENLLSGEAEVVSECVVKDERGCANAAAAEEASFNPSNALDVTNSTNLDPQDVITDSRPVATSFRQLLLSEARAVAGEESAQIQQTPRSRTITGELLSSPDGGASLDMVDKLDHGIWCQVSHDRPIVYITGSAYYFAFVDVDQTCRYFSYARNHVAGGDLLSMTGDREGGWSTLQEKADVIAVSSNGRIVWRVLDEVAYGQLRPNVQSPLGRKWCEAGKEVSSKIAVSNSTAWYLKTDGTVCTQTQLRADRPCYKITHVNCEWQLVQLSCTDGVVWGLRQDGRLVVRIGMKLPECLVGVDWIDFVPDGPSEVVALALYEESAWVLDTQGKLWFCRGVTNQHPIGTTGRWWQVSLPAPLSTNPTSKRRTLPHALCVTPVGVHIAVDRSIWYCLGGVIGHRWSRVVPIERGNVAQFRRLCVSFVFDEKTDYIWLVRFNNEFMMFQPHSKRLQSLAAPSTESETVAVCGALGYMWTLDSLGRIFIRCGIDPVTCPLGSSWQTLDMTQFDGGAEDRVKFTHIACSLDSVWACDQLGRIYVRFGVAPLEETGLPAAWVRLDDTDDGAHCPAEKGNQKHRKRNSEQRERVFRKLFCTPDGTSVWALTRTGRIYARLGITKETPLGSKWLEIDDMKVRTLAVGCGCLWALSEDFELYQRYGITSENPTGNFWKPLSCKLRAITATPSGKLWGLDLDQKLVRHQSTYYSWSNARNGGARSDETTAPSMNKETDQTLHFKHLMELADFEII